MTSMKVQLLFILVCGSMFVCTIASNDPASALWPYVNNLTFPYNTYSPIRVFTNSSRPIITFPRLTVVTQNKIDKLTNTGYSAQVTAAANTGTYTTWGVLGNDTYKYFGVRFFWNRKFGVAASTVDGVGAPLEVIVFFVNEKYTTFSEAILHRDGLAITSTRIKIEGDDNPNFSAFEGYLHQVILAGQSVQIPGSSLGWFQKKIFNYYAYPGSYINLVSKKQYDCATVILNPIDISPSISVRQFKSSFLKLRNRQNETYDNPLASFPRNGRPVIITGPTVVVQSS